MIAPVMLPVPSPSYPYKVPASMIASLTTRVMRLGGTFPPPTFAHFVMVVSRSVPAKTVPEFIDYAKANPGKVNMPSPGTGSAGHVFGELFKIMTGVHIVHVPYRASWVFDLLTVESALRLAIDDMMRWGALGA
jgi:Tripartite tricarboxylate transporter family receptor